MDPPLQPEEHSLQTPHIPTNDATQRIRSSSGVVISNSHPRPSQHGVVSPDLPDVLIHSRHVGFWSLVRYRSKYRGQRRLTNHQNGGMSNSLLVSAHPS